MRPTQRAAECAGSIVYAWAVLSWPLTGLLVYLLPSKTQWISAGTSQVPGYVWLVTGLPAITGCLAGVIVTVVGVRGKLSEPTWKGVTAIISGIALLAGSWLVIGGLAIS